MMAFSRPRAFAATALLPGFLFAWATGCATGLEPSDWRGAELAGKLTDRSGRTVAEARVYLYPAGTSVLGPAEAMSEPSSADGRYVVFAPSGRYTLVARKRLSGASGGPLRNGDLTGHLDEAVLLDPAAVQVRDIVLDVFVQGQEGDPRKVLVTGTRITGLIFNAEGRPVEGAHAFAYRDHAGSDAPDSLSAPTGSGGCFDLSLPGGGSYVVGARTGLRGRPRPGDLVGYWGSRDTAHEVRDGGVIEGVVIRLVAYGAGPTAP